MKLGRARKVARVNPAFDDKDAVILRNRIEAWDKRTGPRVGDFVLMPNGQKRRFTHAWDDGMQTTYPGFGNGSFHFGKEGYMDYSGSLDSSIKFERIVDTGECEEGVAWFFHHNEMRAHNGVDCHVPCRVYRVTEE
jgi:hypothetical protein